MAASVTIINPADKARLMSVSIGDGAPADGDALASVKNHPLGSQYTDYTNKKFHVRTAEAGAAADWTQINV